MRINAFITFGAAAFATVIDDEDENVNSPDDVIPAIAGIFVKSNERRDTVAAWEAVSSFLDVFMSSTFLSSVSRLPSWLRGSSRLRPKASNATRRSVTLRQDQPPQAERSTS